MASRGGRKAGAERIVRQSQVVTSGLKVLSKARSVMVTRQQMAEIWQHMENNPDQVAAIFDSVLQGNFAFKKFDVQFNEKHAYMLRIPKTHAIAWMQSRDQGLSKAFFKIFNKSDRKMWQKVFVYMLISDCNWKIPTHDKVLFTCWCNHRADLHKLNIRWIIRLADGHINTEAAWAKNGLYTLLPVMPEGLPDSARCEHVYTAVKFLDMEIAILPSMPITGAWMLTSNWSVKAATLEAPADCVPRVKFPVSSLCGKHEAFTKMYDSYAAHAFTLDKARVDAMKVEARQIVAEAEGAGAGGHCDAADSDDDMEVSRVAAIAPSGSVAGGISVGSSSSSTAMVAVSQPKATPAPPRAAKRKPDYAKVAQKIKSMKK